jgi:hypothetical protein
MLADESIAGMGFLKDQWNDVKGNIKFAFLMKLVGFLAGSAVLASIVTWVSRFITGIIGVPFSATRVYVILGILIFCAIVLSSTFALSVVIFLQRHDALVPLFTRPPVQFGPERDATLFSPLQIEAFTIAKDLRDFLASLDPFPIDAPRNQGESDTDYLPRVYAYRGEQQGRWRGKLIHGYANRKFGERITSLMHRAGEEVEYPAHFPAFAESPPLAADDVRRLAQTRNGGNLDKSKTAKRDRSTW